MSKRGATLRRNLRCIPPDTALFSIDDSIDDGGGPISLTLPRRFFIAFDDAKTGSPDDDDDDDDDDEDVEFLFVLMVLKSESNSLFKIS